MKLGGLKCEFLLRTVEILGHVISDGCLYAKCDKLQGLRDLRVPQSRTDVKSVYGLLSFFRKFVKNFTVKAKPITDQMGDTEEIVWGEKES